MEWMFRGIGLTCVNRNDSKPPQVFPLDATDNLDLICICDRGTGYAGVLWIYHRCEFPKILFSKIRIGKKVGWGSWSIGHMHELGREADIAIGQMEYAWEAEGGFDR